MHDAIVLAEYEALRNEIVAVTGRRSQRLTITYTVMGALFSASHIVEIPEIAHLALLMIGVAWADDHRQRESIARIGFYIRYFIESKNPGLGWQRVLGEVYKLEARDNLAANQKKKTKPGWFSRSRKTARPNQTKSQKKSKSTFRRVKNTLLSSYGSAALVALLFSIKLIANEGLAFSYDRLYGALIFLLALWSCAIAFSRGMKISDFSATNKARFAEVADTLSTTVGDSVSSVAANTTN